ncbi:toprim domain-containing protein [Herpetosiphon geysericola]|uniref:toprim domain-containing protein n=1 Tax=Herpetosiphon geysericola TaxID=70996 RepID=UPI0006C8F3C5|nr:hypothetical protein [Herpetosiphon geysericola]
MITPPDLLPIGHWQRNEWHACCPFCGKDTKRGQTHFSCYNADGEWRYKCFVCQHTGSIAHLARYLGVATGPTTERQQAKAMQPKHKHANWLKHADFYLGRFGADLNRVPLWQAYKPLNLRSIAQWRLGVGVLPASRCQMPRLIVPVFESGQLVALHGRAYLPEDTDAKWLTSGGSRKDVLYNAEYLAPGKTVIIGENLVDAIIAMQDRPDVVAVASGGVAWAGENLTRWCELIAASQPKRVIVWLDNDLAGQASGAMYRTLLGQWRTTMHQRVAEGKIPRIPTPPEPAGPKIANQLLALHQPVTLYQWPMSAPPKADLGWCLQGAA